MDVGRWCPIKHSRSGPLLHLFCLCLLAWWKADEKTVSFLRLHPRQVINRKKLDTRDICTHKMLKTKGKKFHKKIPIHSYSLPVPLHSSNHYLEIPFLVTLTIYVKYVLYNILYKYRRFCDKEQRVSQSKTFFPFPSPCSICTFSFKLLLGKQT